MGLLDTLGSGTPQANVLSQGLLGMGAGLLSGGAYGALAPALGKGLLGFQQMSHQAQQDQIANQYRDMQAQMLQAQLGMMRQRQQLGMNLLGLGGAPSGGAAPAAPAPTTNQYGTTSYPVAPSGQTPASGQPSAQPSGAPTGIPPSLRNAVALDLVFNGGQGIGSILKPNIQNVRPGGTVYDANTGRVQFSAPSAQGTQVVYDANGNPSVKLLPGAAQATADISTSRAKGPATFRTSVVNLPNGQNVMMTDAQKSQWLTGADSKDPYLNAVLSTESGGSPNAVSPKGAVGPMQTLPTTLTDPGFGVTPAQNNSPQELARVGVDYWKAMNDRYQSPVLAAVAYNMGPGATDQWLKSGGDFSKLPAETQKYVASVMTKAAVNARNSGAPDASSQPSQSQVPGQQVQGEGTIATNTELGKLNAQELDASRAAAINATNELTTIGKERQAFAGGTFGGTGAQARLSAVKFLQGWLPGLSNFDASKVTNTDYVVSMLGSAMLANIKKLGSQPTDSDRETLQAIVGSIGKDPNALSKLIDFQEMMANRVIQRHNLLVGQAQKNGIQSAFDLSVSPQTGMPGSQDFKVLSGPGTPSSGFKIIGVR